MIEADRVHSTPPLNAPIDTNRRRFLTVAAGASVASVGTLTAVAMPAGATDSAACAVDPIFAAIERHHELSAHYDAAVSISGHLPCGPEFDAAEAVTAERCDALLDHANALIRSEPTTMAGALALMRYVASLEEWQTPADRSDMWEASWHRVFLGTVANASTAAQTVANGLDQAAAALMTPFMLHIKAAVAQEERRLISQRTKEALAAAKERGVRLGNQAQADANKAAAAARDADLRPILETMRDRPFAKSRWS